jgi:hypothetical protein
MTSFDELEHNAKRYLESKQNKGLESDSKDAALKIIDFISSQDFKFPVQGEGVVSNGTTSYVYANDLTYPNLFEFIAGILHTKIPITINGTSFGPGEIIVNKGCKEEAEEELDSCLKELQKLIHAKKHLI